MLTITKPVMRYYREIMYILPLCCIVIEILESNFQHFPVAVKSLEYNVLGSCGVHITLCLYKHIKWTFFISNPGKADPELGLGFGLADFLKSGDFCDSVVFCHGSHTPTFGFVQNLSEI